VDTMAPQQGGSLAQTEASARVEIEGVTTLTDYANVERMLESLPGVRRADVSAASGKTVMFDVVARGGGDAISHALAGSTHLVRSDASSARLAYQYRP
jgi:copper chaperone CopZ